MINRNKDYVISNYQMNSLTDSYDIWGNSFTLDEQEANNYYTMTNKYYKSISSNMDIFVNVVLDLSNIDNEKIRNKLIKFIIEFTNILDSLKDIVTNRLTPFVVRNDEKEEGSYFIEWVYKDFRVGFTFCEKDEESMWFILSNSNLDDLSMSGALKETEYRKIIMKVLSFVLENT